MGMQRVCRDGRYVAYMSYYITKRAKSMPSFKAPADGLARDSALRLRQLDSTSMSTRSGAQETGIHEMPSQDTEGARRGARSAFST